MYISYQTYFNKFLVYKHNKPNLNIMNTSQNKKQSSKLMNTMERLKFIK